MFFVIWVISPFKGCRCTLRNFILAFLCIKANLNIDLPVHAVAYGCIWRCPDSLQANYLVWSVCLMWKDSEEITSDEKTKFKRDKNINQAPGSPHVGQISAVRCMSSCTSTQSSNAWGQTHEALQQIYITVEQKMCFFNPTCAFQHVKRWKTLAGTSPPNHICISISLAVRVLFAVRRLSKRRFPNCLARHDITSNRSHSFAFPPCAWSCKVFGILRVWQIGGAHFLADLVAQLRFHRNAKWVGAVTQTCTFSFVLLDVLFYWPTCSHLSRCIFLSCSCMTATAVRSRRAALL